MTPSKKPSHLGFGLAAGAILGIAAGYFMQTKKGKDMIKHAEKSGKELQTKIMKELKHAKGLTKEKYEEIIDKTTAYYVKTKDMAQKDAPEVKRFLMKKWKEIEKEIKSVK